MKNSVIALIWTASLALIGCGAPVGPRPDDAFKTSNTTTTSTTSKTSTTKKKHNKLHFIGSGVVYEYSEQLNDDSCTTGEQKFTSHWAFCSGLKDEERNNECAVADRANTYEAFCTKRSADRL
ncbi:MAG: hypothetical protein V4692_00505 [Bdellovibrionota bacterium]